MVLAVATLGFQTLSAIHHVVAASHSPGRAAVYQIHILASAADSEALEAALALASTLSCAFSSIETTMGF